MTTNEARPTFRVSSVSTRDGALLTPADTDASCYRYAGSLFGTHVVLVPAEEHAALVANQRPVEGPATTCAALLARAGALLDAAGVNGEGLVSAAITYSGAPTLHLQWPAFLRVCQDLPATHGGSGSWRSVRDGVEVMSFAPDGFPVADVVPAPEVVAAGGPS